MNLGGYAGIEQGAEIVFGVVNKRQKRREPYHGGNAGIAQGVEGANAFRCGTGIGLKLFGKGIVGGGERHLNHTFTVAINGTEQLQIAQNEGGFGDQCKAEAVLIRQLENTTGTIENGVNRHVGVAH